MRQRNLSYLGSDVPVLPSFKSRKSQHHHQCHVLDYIIHPGLYWPSVCARHNWLPKV